MKKSGFFSKHSPKDMLSKSFKPAKCSTYLKMAASRLKVLKNKKEVQVQQMKRELAQLLDSGQNQTARIRVEHVVREEKMMAAYDLLEIYCELIVARLPIIESQKECPIDLKEAVASVIFASPRCGDVPEFIDARKHLSAKYGKEFVTAAIELRPNCGVSRLLVEKLSANAPDGPTKLKVLTKIAEEHNVKWDPESFGQSEVQPPDDLLNGPRTFGEGIVLPEVPRTTPKFQAPPSHDKMENQPMDFYQQNPRSSAGNHDFASVQDTISRTTTSSIPREQMKPLVGRPEKGEARESFQREQRSSSSRQSWNMEFKDATSAAQAAAESAERASFAARVAAELSSRAQTATRPHSPSENRSSIGGVRRDERPGRHVTSKHSRDNILEDSSEDSLSERNPSFQNNRPDTIKPEIREISSRRSYKDGHHRGNEFGHISSSGPETLFQDDRGNEYGHISQADDFGPVTYDDSDGPENDTDMLHYEHGGSNDDRYPLSRQKQNDEFSGPKANRNDSRKADTTFSATKDDTKYLASSKSKVCSVQGVQDDMDSADLRGPSMDENSDEGMRLNIKNLTGGRRQKKGSVVPPYTSSQTYDFTYPAGRVSDETPNTVRRPDAASSVERFTNTRKEKLAGNGRGSRVPDYSSDSDSSDSSKDVRKDVKIPSSSRVSTYFDGDSDDDSPSKVDTARSKLGRGLSRRTIPSQSSYTSVSKPKAGSSSEIHVNDSGSRRTPINRTYGVEIPQDHTNWNRNSDQWPKPERTSSGKVSSKANSTSWTSLPEENQKPSVPEPSASGQHKAEKQGSNEKFKASSEPAIAREDSLKKPSHVHPNLPDFETLFARMQALRK